MKHPEFEQILWQEVDLLLKSPSHDREHLERVITFGLELQKIYGGDSQVIKAAAILHDLGRANTQLRGRESALESAHLARSILEQTGFPKEKINLVCQVISEHDQPGFSSQTLEGKILKDADFLDGFGARGILRSVLWAGEGRETISDVIERLKVKMPERIKGLEFPESKKIAEKQYRFVKLFLAFLEPPPILEREPLKGKYLVFEGISGTGKETQARRLVEELGKRGMKAHLVFEPTPETKPILRQWRAEVDDHLMEAFLFIADRRKIMEKKVLPALRAGETVISVRSFISTLVYEAKTPPEEALISFLHTFVPDFDLIFWLDVPPEEAMRRIEKRQQEKKELPGKFEKLTRLREDQKKYKEVLGEFDNVVKLDGTGSPDDIFQQAVEILESRKII